LKVLILTEGSKSFGLGHVSRISSIYDALTMNNFDTEIMVKGDNTVASIIQNRKYKIFDWINSIQDIPFHKFNVIIIDSYTAPKEIYDYISKFNKINVYLDDFKRIEYPKGVVVNGTLFAEELKYPESKDIEYLLGTKYLPLRKDFWDLPPKKFKGNIEQVLVMFGGDDIKNVTPKIMDFLHSYYPQFRCKVIVGKAFQDKNIKEIEKRGKISKNFEIVMYPSGKKIVDLMLESDLGIIASGLMTLYESMCIGLPIITVTTMENQVDVLNRVKRTGFVEDVGWFDSKDITKKLKIKLEKLKDKKEREKKYLLGRKLVDGKGALRIVEYISKKFKRKEDDNTLP